MLRSLLKNPLQQIFSAKDRKWGLTHLQIIHKSSISKTPAEESEPNTSSLTVSYLINSCGVSPQSATTTAKKFQLKHTKNSDSVLSLLKSYGFTTTQIARIITQYPMYLSTNPERIMRPKLEFFLLVVGLSNPQLTDLMSLSPRLLKASLERRLRPNFSSLLSFFGTNQQVAAAMRRNSRLLYCKLDDTFFHNVRTLVSCGVPHSHVTKLATTCPRALLQTTARFKMTVESVREMGLSPLSTMFVQAIGVMTGLSPSTWERKAGVYKNLGWSESEIISAFTKQPSCMLLSEEKIRQVMHFFVKEMHWAPSFLAARPVALCFSLEKRVIPRCSVMNVLRSKGLVKKISSVRFLNLGEEEFATRFVIKYQNKVPEVLQAYKGDLGFVGIEGKSEIMQCNEALL